MHFITCIDRLSVLYSFHIFRPCGRRRRSNTVNLWGGSLTFPALCGESFATAHPAGPPYPAPTLDIAISQTVCANQSASGLWPVKSVAFFELKTFDAAKQPIVSMRIRFGYYGN